MNLRRTPVQLPMRLYVLPNMAAHTGAGVLSHPARMVRGVFKSAMPSYLVARNLDAGMDPTAGWLASLRSVLGVSTDDVAARLDKNRASISKAEAAERDGSISLRNLRKHAAALGCEVEIRLVATRSFEAMADQRLAQINRERKEMRKPRLRKPAPREDPAMPTEAEEEWDRKQFKFGMQRGIA